MERSDRRLAAVLWLMGLAATASLLAAPLERLKPPTLDMEPQLFRLVALVNPVLLLTLAVLVGMALARRVGLDAPLLRGLLCGEGAAPVLRRQLGPALIAGLATASVLALYAMVSAPWFADAAVPDVAMPLVAKLLYGGVAEEIIARWGVMTLVVWIVWRLAGRPARVPATAYVLGACAAAMAFAAGHIPLLIAVMPDPPASVVLAVIAGNAVPGVLFGLLFWRRGLEAAMIAHATGHAVFTLLA